MTYKPTALAGLAGLAGLTSSPALAQEPAFDVGCLVVSNVFASTATDAKAKEVASRALLFYSGRVSALPGPLIESEMLAFQKQFKPADAGTRMNTCAQAMDRGLKNIQAIGGKLAKSK